MAEIVTWPCDFILIWGSVVNDDADCNGGAHLLQKWLHLGPYSDVVTDAWCIPHKCQDFPGYPRSLWSQPQLPSWPRWAKQEQQGSISMRTNSTLQSFSSSSLYFPFLKEILSQTKRSSMQITQEESQFLKILWRRSLRTNPCCDISDHFGSPKSQFVGGQIHLEDFEGRPSSPWGS